jgi:hypothetical protein
VKRSDGRIIGGDGSKWLADLQSEQENDVKKSHYIQTRRDDWQSPRARQDEALRRMVNQPWAENAHEATMSWQWAIGLGLFFGLAILYGIMQWPMPV